MYYLLSELNPDQRCVPNHLIAQWERLVVHNAFGLTHMQMSLATVTSIIRRLPILIFTCGIPLAQGYDLAQLQGMPVPMSAQQYVNVCEALEHSAKIHGVECSRIKLLRPYLDRLLAAGRASHVFGEFTGDIGAQQLNVTIPMKTLDPSPMGYRENMEIIGEILLRYWDDRVALEVHELVDCIDYPGSKTMVVNRSILRHGNVLYHHTFGASIIPRPIGDWAGPMVDYHEHDATAPLAGAIADLRDDLQVTHNLMNATKTQLKLYEMLLLVAHVMGGSTREMFARTSATDMCSGDQNFSFLLSYMFQRVYVQAKVLRSRDRVNMLLSDLPAHFDLAASLPDAMLESSQMCNLVVGDGYVLDPTANLRLFMAQLIYGHNRVKLGGALIIKVMGVHGIIKLADSVPKVKTIVSSYTYCSVYKPLASPYSSMEHYLMLVGKVNEPYNVAPDRISKIATVQFQEWRRVISIIHNAWRGKSADRSYIEDVYGAMDQAGDFTTHRTVKQPARRTMVDAVFTAVGGNIGVPIEKETDEILEGIIWDAFAPLRKAYSANSRSCQLVTKKTKVVPMHQNVHHIHMGQNFRIDFLQMFVSWWANQPPQKMRPDFKSFAEHVFALKGSKNHFVVVDEKKGPLESLVWQQTLVWDATSSPIGMLDALSRQYPSGVWTTKKHNQYYCYKKFVQQLIGAVFTVNPKDEPPYEGK